MFLNRLTLPVDRNEVFDVTNPVKNYIIDGGVTLTTNIEVTATGTILEGTSYVIYYLGTGTEVNTRTLTMFGKDITSLANRNLMIVAFYDGSNWDTIITGMPDEIPNNSITPAKLSSSVRTEVITVEIDTTGTLKDQTRKIRIPFPFRVVDIAFNVLEEISTDNLTILCKVGVTTLRTQTFTSGTVAGTAVPTVVLDELLDNAIGWVDLEVTKTTSGGRVLVSLIVQRV